MRCGGGLFFYRGGYGGRPIALRNHAKVCVSKGAPCLGVGCERWKRLVFYCFFRRLVVMVENDAFMAFARCFLPLVQAKRSLRSLKALILRRRPSNLSFIAGRASSLSFVFSFFCSSRVLLIFSFMFAVLLDIAPLLRWRSFRGRRQLPQAGEVRRPRRAGVVGCGW